ncbi:hypothetical protein CHLNCDRAFT_134674 [Chlorella variabilis]|uniref:Methyltransferase domain-containing protein n=1 Tax=Chlorella variabilis TaxID=554065 RepID=E1ZGH9_CHLVA|nr:hypothetical protein CHLNCDRAFT_134674 [Chlorella variabilis]EFN54936.1 hypothetical protein CHLNCDRAFT_134674 [Chlorella variabilis]|eukprot:XP_005847038.1 hypothetical protein CHLNCDRAFT_134674 [Chlorella variabilis]
MSGLFEAFHQLLAPALEGRPGAHILDVASASGEPAATLAAALPNAHVVSTDVAPPYLELGQARAQQLGLVNISFETADGEDLHQYADDKYDSTAPASFTALRFSDPKELMEAVGNAGLQDLECKELQVDFLLRNDVWWDAMLQMPLPIKAAVSKAQQQRPGEDVFGEARQKMQALLSANGCLTPAGDLDCCTNSCWLISAKKPG